MKMLPHSIMIATCLTCALPGIGLAQDEPAATNREPGNANPALYYWQAAALLPKLEEDRADQLSAIATGASSFEAKVLQGLDFSASLSFLRKAGASQADCDWGLALEEGPGVNVPHLSKVQELSTVTLVLAESELRLGNTAAGIDLLVIAHRIARDTGAGDFLIGHVLQNALEQRTITIAARHCLAWENSERKSYLERLQRMGGLHPLHAAFARELFWVDWFEEQLDENPGLAPEMLGVSDEDPNAVKLKDLDFVKKMTEEYRKTHADVHAAFHLEGENRRKTLARIEATFEKTDNLLVALVMPTISGLDRTETETASMLAALKLVLEHGSGITKEDLEGTSFQLVRADGATELHSETPEVFLRFGK